MRIGWTPALEIESRRPDAPGRLFIDAEIELASDIRRTRAQWQRATGYTARAHDFTAGNVLDAAGETAALTLANAPAGNDLYGVHFKVVITPIVPGAGTNTHKLVIAIETNTDAAGWVERAALQYEVIRTPGETATAVTWPHEFEEVRVPGLDATDEIRLRVKSASGPGGWSFQVHGFNLATDVDPAAGVTYHTGLAIDFHPDGGVALADTAITKIENAVSDSYMTDLGGPPGYVAASPFVVPIIGWSGVGAPDPPDMPIDRVVAFLNPRVDGGQPRNVAFWMCQLFHVRAKDGSGELEVHTPCSSIRSLPAQIGDTPEEITFSWATLPESLKPKPQWGRYITAVYFWAVQADGTLATNVGLGQDSATSQIQTNPRILKTAQITKSGTKWFIATPNLAVLRVRIEGGNYPATATVPFDAVGNRFDLGVAPTKTVQFICRADVPAGASAVFQVRNDADTAWVTVTDGQTTDDLGLAKNEERKGQVILNAPPGLDTTPIVYEFGMRELTIYPLHDCATLRQTRWAVDPVELISETTNAELVALRDDVMQEFQDRVTQLFAQHYIGQITWRVWYGTPERPRWLHIDDFLTHDTAFEGAEAGIPLLGVTALERGTLPPYDTATQTVQPLSYPNKSLKFAYDDIYAKIGVSARFLGPGIEDSATLVSKSLTESEAKDELDALCYLDGSARISSQGRIKVVRMFGPKGSPTVFSREAIAWTSVTPGYRQRVPEIRLPWNWSDDEQRYRDEAKFAHGAALLKLGRAQIDPPRLLPDHISRWIATKSLADKIVNRHGQAFATGLLLWFFGTEYECPQLEPGDPVALPQTLFAARDPNADRALSGELWAFGVIAATSEDFKTFAIWIASSADILGTPAAGARLGFGAPDLYEATPNCNQKGEVTTIFKARGAGSIKYAFNTGAAPAEPSAATVRAAAAQALDLDGVFRSGVLATLPAGHKLKGAAFAYEQPNATGKESKLLPFEITHYEGGVAASVIEKSRTAYQLTAQLFASDLDGDQVRIKWRTSLVSAPLSDYTSGDAGTANPPGDTGLQTQPHATTRTVDRGISDRFLDVWAEDANGNKSAIERILVPAVASADLEAATSSFVATPAFVGTCPTSDLVDTLSWNEAVGVPAAWRVDLFVCETALCDPPTSGPFESDAQSTHPRTALTGVEAGVASTYNRKYRIRMFNSYGELVDDDVDIERTTNYQSC